MVLLPEDRLAPRVLAAYGFSWQSFTGKLPPRKVPDFEIEFVTEGGGTQDINGISYPMVAGDLVWRRPGTLTQGHLPYSCLTVILDLEGESRPGRDPYLVSNPMEPQPDFTVELLGSIPPVTTPDEPGEFHRLFGDLVRHFANPGPGASVHLRALSLELLARLADETGNSGPTGFRSQGAPAPVRRLVRFLRKNFTRKLVLDDMAREAGLSPTYLHALFTGTLGVSPREYLARLRLAKARELLVATRWPAGEVALACGIENVPYFFTQFKRGTGMTPGEFRQRHSPLDE